MSNGTIVSIDGPSASGKSTVAKRVARELGFFYVDSGSLYRGITWKTLNDGSAAANAGVVAVALAESGIEFTSDNDAVCFTIDGVDPGAELRSEAVRENVSEVAAIPEVRTAVLEWLRAMPAIGNLVVEGRDIGSAVFPDIELKFYLDASPEERARRRHADIVGRNEQVDLASVQDSLGRRDRSDSGRKMAPLKIPDGAIVVDTTGMSIDQVVAAIVARARESL